MVARSGLQNRALVVALLASLLLWDLPFGGFALYPFKLLATWFHELSHGLVMTLTGAGFERMEIYQDTSGYAYSYGHPGSVGVALVASAGYMGTAVVGAVLLSKDAAVWGGPAVLVESTEAIMFFYEISVRAKIAAARHP